MTSRGDTPHLVGHQGRRNGKAQAEAPVLVGGAGQPITPDAWPMILGEIGRGDNRPDALASTLADKPGPIYLRSAGGSFLDGLTMATQVEQAGRTVMAAYAGSAAVLILTAGKRRILAENGWLLIHAGWTLAGGPAAILRPQVEHQERLDLAYREWLLEHSKASPETVADWMAGETYLTPAQALHFGLIDEIGPPEKVPKPEPQSVELAAMRRQRQLCAERIASPPRERTPEHNEATVTALSEYRAQAFDAVLVAGVPEAWPNTPTVAAAAADCYAWTDAAIARHQIQGIPLPKHPWPARWACAKCGEWNFHPPICSDGNDARCVFCEPPPQRKKPC